jgi:hypothetical protein
MGRVVGPVIVVLGLVMVGIYRALRDDQIIQDLGTSVEWLESVGIATLIVGAVVFVISFNRSE